MPKGEDRMAQLFAAHATSAAKIAYLMTGDRDLAQDIVQDAFVKLFGFSINTLTLFGLHTPARLFTDATNDALRAELLTTALAQLDAHLAEPIADCLATDADGRPCVEAKTPLDLERDLRLPGGNIFHGDLSFPYADEGAPDGRGHEGRWGVETRHANVLLCGAGALRGGGVSGIPGHNAAMAVLER